MTQTDINVLIEQGREHEFYTSAMWKHTAETVRRMDRNECQLCKANGRYSRGEIVHHVKHLKDRPELAVSIWIPGTNERQLITVCKRCHEKQHPEALRRQNAAQSAEISQERWD